MQNWIVLTRALGNDIVWFQVSHIEQVTIAAGHTQIVQHGEKIAVNEDIAEVMRRIGNAQ